MSIKKYIPNILSSLRLFSPFVLTPLIISGNYLIAFIALCFFLTTDAFDGYLARKWQVQSELGAKIDALADKLILLSLLVPLIINNPLILINLGLEGAISFVNVKRKLDGGNPKTLQIGRIKMVILSLFMAVSYLDNLVVIPSYILGSLCLSTIVLQIKSLCAYFKEMQKEEKIRLNENTLKVKNVEKIISFDEEKKKVKEKKVVSSNNENELKKLADNKKELMELKKDVFNLSSVCDKAKLKNNNFCKIKR